MLLQCNSGESSSLAMVAGMLKVIIQQYAKDNVIGSTADACKLHCLQELLVSMCGSREVNLSYSAWHSGGLLR